jgi:nucleoside phosphorylase
MPNLVLPENIANYKLSLKLLLITATDVETQGLLKQLKPIPGSVEVEIIYFGNHTYYAGVFGSFGAIVVQSGMGSVGATSSTITTLRAIELWQPSTIVMVGIAFGINKKEQKVGDILVSSHIIPYEFSKIRHSGVEFRSELPPASLFLRNRVKNLRGWKFAVEDKFAKVFLGPMLTGEKLIDDPVFLKSLVDRFPNAIGGEMESAGVYAAAAEENVPWIIIKGICDFADGNKSNNKEQNQQLAISSAVDFTSHLFSNSNAFDNFLVKISSSDDNIYEEAVAPIILEDLISFLDAGSAPSTQQLNERINIIAREVFQNIQDKHLATQRTETLDLLPSTTIDIFVKRVNTCWNDYNKALASEDAFSHAELDRATNALVRCICRELTRVYKLNGNSIPNKGQWKVWWNTYKCEVQL